MIKEFTIESSKIEIIDITEQTKKIVKESKVKEGICVVYTAHATCAVMINENWDPNIMDDILEALDKLIPQGKWRHDKVDNNGAAHIKASIIGPSETIPIKDGKLTLGQWQDIMLADFDGPRQRKVIVEILKK
ncbi:secondary thiamine-phosphate synthase enzyme YjbQ [Candidatus Woesearchaeota archaeon]|nr:secondary thiamine-phosphate synthase enzyme YjbQ [Candidatus Woesearchaeota archaeon]